MISHEYNGRYGEKGSTTLLFFKKIKMAHNLQRNTEELNSTVEVCRVEVLESRSRVLKWRGRVIKTATNANASSTHNENMSTQQSHINANFRCWWLKNG